MYGVEGEKGKRRANTITINLTEKEYKIMCIYQPPQQFADPYKVRVWREYYDFHELAATSRRKCPNYATARIVASAFLKKYKTGNGVNRVYCEVLDAKGRHVPLQVWYK